MRVLDETHDSSRYSRTRWHKQGHERVSDRTALPKHTQYKQESASCRKLMERTQKQHLRVLDDQWLAAENNNNHNRTHVVWSTAIHLTSEDKLCYHVINMFGYQEKVTEWLFIWQHVKNNHFFNTFKAEVLFLNQQTKKNVANNDCFQTGF